MPPKPSKRPTSSEVTKARAAADAIVKRALADKAFRQKLFKSPAATLKAAGVSKKAVEDVGRELVIDGISLMAACAESCWVSCLSTCRFSGKGKLGGDVSNPA